MAKIFLEKGAPLYESPKIDVTEFDTDDVVRTSTVNGDDNDGAWDGAWDRT